MEKNKKIKILYHLPNPNTIYAGRTIYYGYKHAFEDLGHQFKALSPEDNAFELFSEFKPDIFLTSVGPLTFRYLDLVLLKKVKKRGTKVFVNVPFWNSPMSRFRINEVQSLSSNKEWVKLISSNSFGDVYFNICEQNDEKMHGFEKTTGYKHHTVLLAVDKTIPQPKFSEEFASDISFIGTYLPGKQEFIKKHVFPLMKKYKVKLYGRDWTLANRLSNFVQKIGQYYNIPIVKEINKFKPTIEEEREIHFSSTIALNIHEDYQKTNIGEFNERTFKIPASGGFEIVDNVPILKKYFKEDQDIVIGHNTNDWFSKIEYYLQNPNRRRSIIDAGRKKVLEHHTYHNRVEQLLSLYHKL